MSLEFNRRSFLKYTAVAAVAVAGSSLLTGCGEDEYQKTGKIGSTLELMGTHKMTKAPVYDASSTTKTFTTTLSIKCTTKNNPLYVTNECFELTVNPSEKNERNFLGSSIKIYDQYGQEGGEYDVSKDEGAKSFTIVVNCRDYEFKNGQTVNFKYWPRLKASGGQYGYTRAFCTWKMTAKVDDAGNVTFE